MKKVKEVELEFARKLGQALADILQDLGYSVPQSHQIKASLLDSNGRKKRSSASADHWSPALGLIEIRFVPVTQRRQGVSATASQPAAKQPAAKIDNKIDKLSEGIPGVHPAEADLLMALARAESRPGWNFVPLKKFRDEILPQEHLPSIPTDVHRRSVLTAVIEKKFVLLGKVINPKSPQFPVTTIRLNRLMPEVKLILGQTGSQDLDFHPVQICGEPLSSTILRERR